MYIYIYICVCVYTHARMLAGGGDIHLNGALHMIVYSGSSGQVSHRAAFSFLRCTRESYSEFSFGCFSSCIEPCIAADPCPCQSRVVKAKSSNS